MFLSQVLPFYDETAIDLFGKFETEVYRALRSDPSIVSARAPKTLAPLGPVGAS